MTLSKYRLINPLVSLHRRLDREVLLHASPTGTLVDHRYARKALNSTLYIIDQKTRLFVPYHFTAGA